MAKKRTNKKKNPVGRPKLNLKVDTILNLIDSDDVNPTVVNLALILGCSTNPLRRFIKEHPEIQEALDLRWDKLRDKSYEVWTEILDGEDVKAKLDLSKWIQKMTNPIFKEQIDVKHDGEITIKIKGLDDIEI